MQDVLFNRIKFWFFLTTLQKVHNRDAFWYNQWWLTAVLIIFNTHGLQSLRQSDYTPFTLELNCSGICSQEYQAGSVRARVWVLDPQCTCFNWIARHGNFYSRYPCLRFVYLRLFQGLWLDTFLRMARGADLTTVNSKGEISTVRLGSDC
jgi:hypothetical protein